MTLKEHLLKNITLASPVVVGQLGHIFVSVADTAMVGRVGVIPLAAATFAGSFYHVLLLFGIGVSYAITPLVAATKPTEKKTLLSYLQNALLLNFVIGIGLFAIALLIRPFISNFGQEAEVVEAAGPYLVIATSSLIPVMVFQTLRQYSEGLSDTFSPMMVSVFANVVNVGLNYLLIYGEMGFPQLGLNGAAWATLIARALMMLLMIVWVRKRWRGIQFRFDWNRIKQMLRLGIPSGMQYVFEIGAFATAAIMVGWISAEALAAHQIALNIAAVSYMAATGLAAASTIRIGNQMGLKNLSDLKMAGYSSFVMVAIFMAGCSLIFILFRNELISVYIDDIGVQQVAGTLLIIAAGFQVSDGLQAVGLGVLRGLTDVKVPTLITFFAYWIVAIPGCYVLGFVFDLGVEGVWYSLSFGLTLAAILHILRFRSLVKKIRF